MRKVLTIPIYECKVNLVVTKKFEDAVVEAGWEGDVGGADGICLHYTDNPSFYTIVFRKGQISPKKIAHESYHLTKKILHVCDIEDSNDSHEAGAYLLGFIVDLITQAIHGNED